MDAIRLTEGIKRLARTASKYVLYILLGSCIQPFDIEPSQFQETIIVQGMITNEPGPYEIMISKAIPVQEQLEGNGGLAGASVKIEDDHGFSEQLIEKSVGHFYTTAIQGTVGTTYTITVTTGDGAVYQSTPEKLNPVGDFSLRYEFKQVEDSSANQQITSANGFNIFMNSTVVPEQEGRVWWRSTGTYHVQTSPDEKVALVTGLPPPAGPPPFYVPAPPPCGSTDRHPTCTCCDCWISVYGQVPVVSDPAFINNGEISNLYVAFLEANRRTMYDKYDFEVEQLSVSDAVYNFWKRVSIQKSNNSNLFQTPFPPTGGTFTALTKGATPMVGYFAASSVVRKSIVVTRENVPYHIYVIDDMPDSCLELFRGSSNKKPIFW